MEKTNFRYQVNKHSYECKFRPVFIHIGQKGYLTNDEYYQYRNGCIGMFNRLKTAIYDYRIPQHTLCEFNIGVRDGGIAHFYVHI